MLFQWMMVFTLLLILLSACELVGYIRTAVSDIERCQSKFDDPFAYCAEIDTIDVPDEQYSGPKMPDVSVKILRKKLGLSDEVPTDWIVKGTVCPCMNGKV